MTATYTCSNRGRRDSYETEGEKERQESVEKKERRTENAPLDPVDHEEAPRPHRDGLREVCRTPVE